MDTQKALKSTTYNFIGYVWPMVFSILTTPIIVLNLGVKEYGILVFINSIVGIISLLDLGISTSVTKFLIEYQAKNQEEESKKLIYTANSIFFGIGIVGFLITLFISIAGSFIMPDKITDKNYYLILFLFAGINFFLNSVNNLYNLIPTVAHRFDIAVKMNTIISTSTTIITLITVLLGYKLKALLFIQIITTLITIIIRRKIAIKILPIAKYKLAFVKTEAIRCYKFGVATAINSTASISLALLDRLIIPLFVGPTQLTYYSLPGNIPARIPAITDNLSGIIFPVSASLQSAGHEERLKRFYIRSVRLIFLISSAITLSIIFLADKILLYWINADFAEKSTQILIILAVTNFIISLLSPINSFFLGIGKLKHLSIISFSMAIINAILLFLWLPSYGITGASWAYLISVLPIFYTIYLIENKHLHLENRLKYYFEAIFKMIATGTALFILVKILVYPIISNFATLFVLGPATVGLYFVLYLAFGFFEKEDLDDFRKFTLLIINKLPIKRK